MARTNDSSGSSLARALRALAEVPLDGDLAAEVWSWSVVDVVAIRIGAKNDIHDVRDLREALTLLAARLDSSGQGAP